MRRLRILALSALTAAALTIGVPAVAGGGGHGACPAFGPGDATEIVLHDSCFAPVSATAPAGSALTIRNAGRQPHTYTAVDGSFDTGVLQPGDSVTVELPQTTGTVPVYCTLHADPAGNGMAGTVTLSAAASGNSMAGFGPSGIALAGGFLLGSAAVGAIRKRRRQSQPEAVSR